MTVNVTSGGTVPGPTGATGSAGAAGPAGFPLPLRSIATRSSIYKQGFSSGVGTLGATSHHVMRVEVDCSDPVVCYGNFGWGGAQAAVNDLLVDSVAYLPTARLVPFYFNGASTVRVGMPRGLAWSVPLGEDVKRGDVIGIRTFYRCDAIVGVGDTVNGSATVSNVVQTSGQFGNGQAISGTGIPGGATISSGGGTGTLTLSAAATATATGVTLTAVGLAPNDWFSDSGNGSPWYQTGNHLLDAAAPTPLPGPAYANTFYYSPVGLFSRRLVANAAPTWGLLGDSNFHGQGDDQTPPTTNDLSGLARRALNDRCPYMHLAQSGMGIVQIAEGNRHPTMALVDGCDYLLIGMLVNDLGAGRTAAQIVADVNTVAGWAKQRGVKAVVACTCQPNTSSTDNWATTANQTVGGQESIRTGTGAPLGINPRYRDLTSMNAGQQLSNVDWIADVASAVEVDNSNALTLNGGKWQVLGNGLNPPSMGSAPHFTSAGHAAAAVLIADAMTNVEAGNRKGISKAF